MEVAYEAMKNTYERFGLKDKLTHALQQSQG